MTASAQRRVDAFNRRHKVGDTITVYSGLIGENPREVQIIEPGASVLSGHTAVVWVTGGHGCIALSHVARP